MKRFRRFTAVLLAVCTLCSTGGATIHAEEIDQPWDMVEDAQAEAAASENVQTSEEAVQPAEEQQVEEEGAGDTVTGADALAQEEDAEALDALEALMTEEEKTKEIAQDILINYLAVGKGQITTPDSQQILIGIDSSYGCPSSASLVIVNTSTGAEYTMAASSLQPDVLLFEMTFPDEQYSGVYQVKSLEYKIGENSFHLDFEATGITAGFGVNTDADTDPDNVVVDESDEESLTTGLEENPGIVISDADGNEVTGEDFKNAIESAGVSDENALARKSANGKLVVVLDPGHGGSDSGTTATVNGTVYVERDINLKIAQYCKAELETYSGVEVYLTRTDNTSTCMSREERANFAASKGADVLVSIHINQAGEKGTTTSAHGAEVYYPNSNYNANISAVGQALANNILIQLESVGMANRGAKIKNASDLKYPDGSVADYYGINYYCKKLGFPGIIVEHAFVNNVSDATNHLTTDAQLKELGVADAKGIATYYGLSKEVEYASDAARVGVTSGYGTPDGWKVDHNTYTLTADNIQKAYSMFFAVYNGSGTVKWYNGTLSGDRWYGSFKISDFAETGKYYIDAYVVRTNGSYYCVGRGSLEFGASASAEIAIQNVNNVNGTFDVVVSSVTASNEVASVSVPAWTKQDLSDLHWYEAEKQSNGTYVAHVNVANHQFNYGTYAVQAYVVDNAGIRILTSSKCYTLEVPETTLGSMGLGDGTSFVLTADNLPGRESVAGVRFGVWHDGLNDLRWFGTLKEGNRFMAFLNVADYQRSGEFYADAYVDYTDGTSVRLGNVKFYVEDPTASAVDAYQANNAAGTFDVVVSGAQAPGGVGSVRIAAWTAPDLSDLYWYDTCPAGDGKYVAQINVANHKYNYGVYAMSVYVTGQNNVTANPVSNCYNLIMPETKIESCYSGNGSNYFLTAENVPYSSSIIGVQFGVWHDGLSDLKWYGTTIDSYGRWLSIVNLEDYQKSGTYGYGAYAVLRDGTRIKVGEGNFSQEGPKATGLEIKNKDESNGTFTIEITGVSAPTGVAQVKVPVWCAADQSDLVWYVATQTEPGTYQVQVDVQNHKGNLGTYWAHVYVTDNMKITENVGQISTSMVNVNNTCYNIMGTSSTSVEQMVRYYNKHATYPSFYSNTDAPMIWDFCRIYYEECQAEGVKAEVAFAQAMKETGFLRYNGTVKIEQFNFAGIGAVDSGATPSASFSSVREGVRAQVQHLKGYATKDSLNQECVDPRFNLLNAKRGCAPYVEWLGQKENPYGYGWATDKNYGYSIRNDYMKLLLES